MSTSRTAILALLACAACGTEAAPAPTVVAADASPDTALDTSAAAPDSPGDATVPDLGISECAVSDAPRSVTDGAGGEACVGTSPCWSVVKTETMRVLGHIAMTAPWDAWALFASDPTFHPPSTPPLHWDGTAWRKMTSPVAPDIGIVGSVSATSASDVWFGGTNGARHWDGCAWSTHLVASTFGRHGQFVPIIAGASVNDVWTTGYTYAIESTSDVVDLVVNHWNGTKWTEVMRRAPLTRTQPFLAVSRAGDVVTSDEQNRAMLWTGTKLELMPPPPVRPQVALWINSKADIWLDSSNNIGPVVFTHYDGVGWTTTTLPTWRAAGMWAAAPNDAWVCGWKTGTPFVGAVAHWDGRTWSDVTIPPSGQLWGISGSGPTDVWVTRRDGAMLHLHP